MCVPSPFSRVRLLVTPWIVALQAPLSMQFSRQKYWSGLPCPPSGDLPDPGIEPACLTSLALADRFFTTSTTWEAQGLGSGPRKTRPSAHMCTHWCDISSLILFGGNKYYLCSHYSVNWQERQDYRCVLGR